MIGLGLETTPSYASSTGWVQTSGKWYYYENQKPVKGWKFIHNQWYYLDSNGVMKTGWIFINGKWYYLQSNGAMKTGWLYLSGKWYYLNSSGSLATGWFRVNGDWYYSNANGVMQTGRVTINGEDFNFNSNGIWIPFKKDLVGKTIVLDPGHGGYDSGAAGGGILEKNITLEVGLKLTEVLKAHGATVYMTRNTDKYVSLKDRVQYSNSIKPDAFISIHVNSDDSISSNARGIETYYNSIYGVMPADSKRLATELQEELIKSTGTVTRKVKDENFYVTRENDAPAVLVEIGFITNSQERANLITDRYQNKLCTGFENGLVKFFNH